LTEFAESSSDPSAIDHAAIFRKWVVARKSKMIRTRAVVAWQSGRRGRVLSSAVGHPIDEKLDSDTAPRESQAPFHNITYPIEVGVSVNVFSEKAPISRSADRCRRVGFSSV